ncbi:hypothetical protein [Thermococcus sp.]|uniref:hypothetical protein n=1 Tax=Thermococcus sp. TaxID=35749 RepID=UPI002613DF13|nr:hypothetical protein [Thermococcus sp.]
MREEIQKRISKLQDITNEEKFLQEVLRVLGELYGSETSKLQELLRKDKKELLIAELLKLRFLEEFESLPKDMYELTSDPKEWDLLIQEKNILAVKNTETNERLVFYPLLTEQQGYVKPYNIGKTKNYKLVLIKQKDKKLEIATTRRTISRAIREIKEKVNLAKTVDNIETFGLSPAEIFEKLNNRGIYVTKIRLSGYPYSMMLKSWSDMYIPLGSFNLDKLLANPEDIVKLREIHLEYRKKEKNLPFTLTIVKSKAEIKNAQLDKKSIEKKYIFEIKVSFDNEVSEDDKKKIIKSIKDVGIRLNYPYEVPVSYYFSRMIFDRQNRGRYYRIIKSMKEDDEVIKQLETSKIITIKENSPRFWIHKFGKFLEEKFSEILNVPIIINNKITGLTEKFEIFNVEYVESEKSLVIQGTRQFDYPDGGSYKYFLTIVIPLDSQKKSHKKTRYQRLTYVFLDDANLYEIICNILKGEKSNALLEIYRKAVLYLDYYYLKVLENEATTAYMMLKNKEELKNMSGEQIEENIAVILKYLYGSFIPKGYKYNESEPDGILILFEDSKDKALFHTYVIDSKQHERLSRDEIRKMWEYLKGYLQKISLGDVKSNKFGIFIMSRSRLQTNSLNLPAREEISKLGIDMEMGVVTTEFILGLFEIYREHRNLLNALELTKELKTAFISVAKKSVEINEVSELVKYENKTLDWLKKEIGKHLPKFSPQWTSREL